MIVKSRRIATLQLEIMQEKQIKEWFKIWWASRESLYANVEQKEIFWFAFRAGFIRCLTDAGEDKTFRKSLEKN